MSDRPAATVNQSCGAQVPLAQRRRIWQLETSMHCSVIGTCLSMTDLHTIARRARCQLDPSESPYAVHSWFVDLMAFPNDLSKLVDKELEKRHRVAAQKVRRARNQEELEALWKELVAHGLIAGAYWGALSHPLCSRELQWRMFGDVHMLSHLVGASRRSDVGRVHQLETACAELDGRLAQSKHDHRSVLKDRKKLEDELTSARLDRERSERRLTNANQRIAALESETLVSEHEARIAEMERQIAEANARASAAESSLSDARARLKEAMAAGEHAAERARELLEENEALEVELTESAVLRATRESTQDDASPHANPASLRGKRILCVGGRSNLVQHYRALVERHGGELVHHDGGLEESLEAVTRSLHTVDAVLCPIDCVSHAACLKVKRACKHLAKRFIPLRSSGLSSFARGIQAVTASEMAAEQHQAAE